MFGRDIWGAAVLDIRINVVKNDVAVSGGPYDSVVASCVAIPGVVVPAGVFVYGEDAGSSISESSVFRTGC